MQRTISKLAAAPIDVPRMESVLSCICELLRDSDDRVDAKQFLCGICNLCGGDREEKTTVSFSLFDGDRDGYISRDELFVLIRSLLLVTFGTLSQLHGKQLVLEWADLNSKFCMNSVFAVGELSRPDHVNKEEFSRFVDEFPNLVSWIRLGETILDIPGADIPSPALRLRKNSGETLVVQLKDIENINVQRRNSHLSDLEFGLLFKVFEQEAMNGHLNKAQFRRCLHKLLPSLQPSEEYDEGFKDFQFANLFAMFDLNGDGVVELSEFGAAMSLLCKGTKTEKLLLGFNLFEGLRFRGEESPDITEHRAT